MQGEGNPTTSMKTGITVQAGSEEPRTTPQTRIEQFAWSERARCIDPIEEYTGTEGRKCGLGFRTTSWP